MFLYNGSMSHRTKWILLVLTMVVVGVFVLRFVFGKQEGSVSELISTPSVTQPVLSGPVEGVSQAEPLSGIDPVGLYDPAVWTLVRSTSSNLDGENTVEHVFLFRSTNEAARGPAGEALYEIQVLLARKSVIYDYQRNTFRRSKNFPVDPMRFFYDDRLEIRMTDASEFPEVIFSSGYPGESGTVVLEHSVRYDKGKNAFLHFSSPV